jgi:hypothetical protein
MMTASVTNAGQSRFEIERRQCLQEIAKYTLPLPKPKGKSRPQRARV